MNDSTQLNAYENLLKFLEDGEIVEAIVFGEWEGLPELEPKPPIPLEKRGILLTLEEAKTYMESWRFYGDYTECSLNIGYVAYIWTNKRVIWVSCYDGETWLSSAPRNPTEGKPMMSGGG